MKMFISCDWGTSSLRLRLTDVTNKAVLYEAASLNGISHTFELWKKTGRAESERLSFYQSVLSGQIKRLEEQLNISLENMPLIISGMASSNIGMMELPYAEIPFGINEVSAKMIVSENNFRHSILLISGVKKNDDVMRGEETQLIGCLNNNNNEDQLFIFPGTHSKHILIKNAKVADFKTYMTGEFFELLSKKSILAGSVEESKDVTNGNNLKSFESGVMDSLRLNILHSAFRARTNYLFGKLTKAQNYFYLSGLMVGAELKELTALRLPLTIVSDELQAKLYNVGLQKAGIPRVKNEDAGKAIISGHCKLYNLYYSELAGELF